jgi:GT2 family glycosyltransferase
VRGAVTGVVAIGRNEGERLRQCLLSLVGADQRPIAVVYVDSGSTDGSVAFARSLGVDVVELSLATPFTAARARNAGMARLQQLASNVEYVQFIDGDCEMNPTWLSFAVDFLASHADAAVVCGRRRERFPQRSVYNLLCDFDWEGPIGEVNACGGDSLMRVAALAAVRGFNDSLIAGEEPELCVRLRQAGWKVFRVDREMCLHDAAMLHFRQWWRRSARAGHAYAEGAWLHGRPPERLGVRSVVSALIWGFLLPAIVFIGALAGSAMVLWLLLLYPLQVFRLALTGRRSPRENWLNAFFLVLAKFAEFTGHVRFLARRMRGGPATLIEYK